MSTWAERAKAALAENGQNCTVKTDETHDFRHLAVSSVPAELVFQLNEPLSSVLTVPPTIELEKHNFSIEEIGNADCWCWPHSSAMNAEEIDAYKARLARFTGKGLSLKEGEALADKLVARDRETDHRRLCLECVHLAGRGVGLWICKNWQAASVSIRSKNARLPHELVHQLQYCDRFSETAK